MTGIGIVPGFKFGRHNFGIGVEPQTPDALVTGDRTREFFDEAHGKEGCRMGSRSKAAMASVTATYFSILMPILPFTS